MKGLKVLLILVLVGGMLPASAITRYVAIASTNPVAPFLAWETAATNIQDAIDVSDSNDRVLVSNGVYATGGRVVYGTLTNRIAITNAVTVQSVNGPDVTLIVGAKDPVSINGNAAIRCAFAGTNAVLSGFTLTSGATRTNSEYSVESSGGGAWCEPSAIITNCVLIGNVSFYSGGGSVGGTLNNCTLTRNSSDGMGGGTSYGVVNACTLTSNTAYSGGASQGSEVNNCILIGNAASYGGGVSSGCTLTNCTLIGNTGQFGGGSNASTLNNCVVNGNSAGFGGGSFGGTLNNCIVSSNSALNGGGSYNDNLNNCILTGNSASFGGGSYGAYLNNCTLTDNRASYGGGSYNATLINCISYFNTAGGGGPNFHNNVSMNYCCSTPLAPGTGNITNDPQIASLSNPRILLGSPCVNAGTNQSWMTDIADMDGEPRLNGVVDIGADEYWSGGATGSLVVAIQMSATNFAPNTTQLFMSVISGKPQGFVWSFGDGDQATNAAIIAHSFVSTGSYQIVLITSNASGSATAVVQVLVQDVNIFVAPSGSDTNSGLSWTAAKATIQGGVDAMPYQGNGKVWVSNGVYATGGRVVYGAMTNRVAITNAIAVQSVNGPDVTSIVGAGPNSDSAIRCVYLGTNAVLTGFTLMKGATRTTGDVARERTGGGVWCESGAVVNLCTLNGNSAVYGGGSFAGTLHNCLILCNAATNGGGSFASTLDNCTLSGNSAASGGGSYGGRLNNCIVYFNYAPNGPNYLASVLVNYCCTMPMTSNGTGNITNDPQFVDAASSNFHLLATAPCIDRGNNAYATNSTVDLDGSPRVMYGTVDMGAYEAQFPVGYWVWAGAITNGQTNLTDSAAGDGYPNLLKYATGGSPTNSDEVARMDGVRTGGLVALQFSRNTNAADVTLIVEGSDAVTNDVLWAGIATNRLGSWGGATNVVESSTSTLVFVTVQDNVSSATNRFLRLRVTRP